MALKGKREGANRAYHLPAPFMNEVAEPGGVVVMSTAASGSAFGDSAQVCTYAAAPSGKLVLGVLVDDVVDTDQTRFHLNWHKSEVPKNSPVAIMNRGFVTTDYTEGTISTVGTAYLAHSGRIARTDLIGGNQVVGVIESTPDEDGYVRFRFNLP